MKKILITTAILAIVSVSCEKKKERQIVTIDTGLYVLNEGNGGLSNADMTYYDFETGLVYQNVFFNQNDRELGDVGNDILIYGGKIYISVGGSSTIEITDLDLKSIKQISFDGNSVKAREPQGLAAHNGKVYIVCFDGHVAKLDTVTLTVEDFVAVGDNPLDIAISKGFAYVTNSGGMNYLIGADYDSTVSVIDLATFKEVKKITVSLNPASIDTDENGDIIVSCTGNYWDIPASLHRINTTTNTLAKTFSDVELSGFVMKGSFAYIFSHDWAGNSQFVELNTLTDVITKTNVIADPSLVPMPHGMTINSVNEEIYVANAEWIGAGKVFGFDKTGIKLFEFSTGNWPKKIAILK